MFTKGFMFEFLMLISAILTIQVNIELKVELNDKNMKRNET